MTEKIKEKYLIGIDVGSTTTKIAVVDEKTVLWHVWNRITSKKSFGLY